MKAFQLKYAGVSNPSGYEHIQGSRNNGPNKTRRRVWRGPRFYPGTTIRMSGPAKALARLQFDAQIKNALS